MGNKISQFKEQLFTQTNDFENKINPENFARKQGQSLMSYLFQTKQQKQININFNSFKSKKFYKQTQSLTELDKHLAKIKAKEQILKEFKYHEDFDRIDFAEYPFMVSLQNMIEKTIVMGITIAIICSRVTSINLLKDLYSNAAWKRHFWNSFIVIIPYSIYFIATSQYYQIQNHQFFSTLKNEERLYYNLDEKLDLYKYNEDIKYNFIYPSTEQFFQVREKVHKKLDEALEKQTLAYYSQLAGKTDHKNGIKNSIL